MTRIALALVGAALLLGGCGKKTVLHPAEGHPLPPKARTAATQPGVLQLLTPATQARPGRDDELVIKSAPLQPDHFDLPPPG
jgi:hypothetical protein